MNNYKRQEKDIDFITLKKDNITIENPFNTIVSVWDKTSYKTVDQFLILNIPDNRLSFIFTKSEFKENDDSILTAFLQKYSRKEI